MNQSSCCSNVLGHRRCRSGRPHHITLPQCLRDLVGREEFDIPAEAFSAFNDFVILSPPLIVEFLGTGEVVRIETTNGWCLLVDFLPSHVHRAITPTQLGFSVYQTLDEITNSQKNNITDDLDVILTITNYNQNATAKLDVELVITNLEGTNRPPTTEGENDTCTVYFGNYNNET
ncbi:hypothetical protein Bca4012_060532 [Brassica carinata]